MSQNFLASLNGSPTKQKEPYSSQHKMVWEPIFGVEQYVQLQIWVPTPFFVLTDSVIYSKYHFKAGKGSLKFGTRIS